MHEFLIGPLGFWTPISIFILTLMVASIKKVKTDVETSKNEENMIVPELDKILEYE